MISKETLQKDTEYEKNGYLVHSDKAPYGILLYREIKNIQNYKPWDKIRIAEVFWVKGRKIWMVGKAKLKGGAIKSLKYEEKIGVPSVLWDEFVEAAQILLDEMRGKEPNTVELKLGIPTVVREQKKDDTEEEDKLMRSLGMIK